MYTVTTGTLVSSTTQHSDNDYTYTSSHDGILFDYHFEDHEFLNEVDGFHLFIRTSEDGKRHLYFVDSTGVSH